MNKRVSIINIDSTIPNIALKKIEKYYQDKNYEIVWDNELMTSVSDYTYVSCIFQKNKYKCNEWEGRAFIGGTGYDIHSKLSPEIECMKPKINIGFTTRGCIRKCPFCFVPEKEGNIKIEGDIYDFWDGVSKEIIILDNNIIALPDHFYYISKQIKENKLKVDFNQGLDFRLLTNDIIKIILSLRHIHEIRFAYDNIHYEKQVIKALELLKNNNIKDWQTRWYIYISEDDTFETVYSRMKLIKSYKQLVYIMRDKKIYKNPEYILLSGWGNTVGAYKYGLNEAINKSKRMKPYKKYYENWKEKYGE